MQHSPDGLELPCRPLEHHTQARDAEVSHVLALGMADSVMLSGQAVWARYSCLLQVIQLAESIGHETSQLSALQAHEFVSGAHHRNNFTSGSSLLTIFHCIGTWTGRHLPKVTGHVSRSR